LQTGCTGIQHAVLCCNRQAKAELDGLRIEMSLVHDDIDNRHSTATALWVTAPCQPSPSLRRTAALFAMVQHARASHR
jgi:hypothetical protein